MPRMERGSRTLGQACGLIGPVAFTAAWAASSRRQPGYSSRHEHISGLAAPDARDPHLMTAGFGALGVCTVAFGRELHRRLSSGSRGPGLGPVLMSAGGLAVLVASAFRRDRISNVPPPGEPQRRQSVVNDVHDVASILAAGSAAGAMLALAARFRGDPAWRGLALPTAAAAIASGALDLVFASNVTRPGNGIVQRAAVSLPLGAMASIAVRIFRTGA